MDSFHTYDTPWADVSNTLFWGYMEHVPPGRQRHVVPPARPAGLRLARGAIRNEVAHTIDLAPAFLAVASVARPAEFAGKLFMGYNDNAFVRAGDWKLARFDKGPCELYDLARDRAEQHNLAAAEPARAQELVALWKAWWRRVGGDKLPPKKAGAREN